MSQLVLIGRLAGAFGVQGQVIVRSLTFPDRACLGYGPLLDASGAVCLTPLRHRRQKPRYLIVTPQENRAREDWIAIRGLALHTLMDRLAPLEDDQLYVAGLIGCSVEHVDGRELGTVRDVHNFGAGDLLDMVCGHTSYYLPFTDEIASEIKVKERRILSRCQDEWLPDHLRRPA